MAADNVNISFSSSSADLGQALSQLQSVVERESEAGERAALDELLAVLSSQSVADTAAVEVGRSVRRVVRRFDLPAEAVAALVDLRAQVGSAPETMPHLWGALIADRTREFVGRRYVFEAIDEFLTENQCGYLVLQGDPGMGKSAILAEYVRRTGCVVHFNVRSVGVSSAAQFIRSVCAQLVADVGLPHPVMPSNAVDSGAFLLSLLVDARQRLPKEEPLVIAVDALDEVDGSAQPDVANLLFLPPVLPDGVFFVMTSRNVDVRLVAQSPYRELDLMAHGTENREDVKAYVSAAMSRPELAAWAREYGGGVDGAISDLAERSEDNFMYLRYVMPEIERGAYRRFGTDRLPRGLENYYGDHWRMMGMTARPLPRTKLLIVFTLCEARQAVSRSLLASIATDPVDELTVQEVLDEWKQFLHEERVLGQTRYSPYHTSFRDFLHRKDIVQAAGLTIEWVHGQIADLLWRTTFEQ
ncbi:ATP-binding protein [Lentzea atacamensis]|uniref:ATP-binding protein n=1 Tax=Lentzea atacamensis TaxID=531938 RepID=UPI000DD4DF37|nr:ATP-binding protein [Lentzea atacamensis]